MAALIVEDVVSSEEKPRCAACLRRNIACQYTVAAGPRRHHQPDGFSSHIHTHSPGSEDSTRHQNNHVLLSQPLPPPPPPPPPISAAAISPRAAASASAPSHSLDPHADPIPFTIKEIALLHFWTTCTSVDLFRQPDMNELWQVTVPQIGFEYDFVLYAILSLTALHRAHLDLDQDSSSCRAHTIDATRYYNEGLRGFRVAVNSITPQNGEALFIWAVMNTLYVFAISKETSSTTTTGTTTGAGIVADADAADPGRKDRILGSEWIPLTRGIMAVINPIHESLRSSRLGRIFFLGNWDQLNPADYMLIPGAEQLLATRETWADSNNHAAETYEEALNLLRRSHCFTGQFESMDSSALDQMGCHRASAGPLIFIHLAPEGYLRLLKQRQPPALILFAFFGALLHNTGNHWFFEGWGKDIVQVVDELLGAYWRPWISWPLEIIKT